MHVLQLFGELLREQALLPEGNGEGVPSSGETFEKTTPPQPVPSVEELLRRGDRLALHRDNPTVMRHRQKTQKALQAICITLGF